MNNQLKQDEYRQNQDSDISQDMITRQQNSNMLVSIPKLGWTPNMQF
jgi:hypothetical protein